VDLLLLSRMDELLVTTHPLWPHGASHGAGGYWRAQHLVPKVCPPPYRRRPQKPVCTCASNLPLEPSEASRRAALRTGLWKRATRWPLR